MPAEKKWMSSVGEEVDVSGGGPRWDGPRWDGRGGGEVEVWGSGNGNGGGDLLRFGQTDGSGGRAERVTTMVADFQTSVGGWQKLVGAHM